MYLHLKLFITQMKTLKWLVYWHVENTRIHHQLLTWVVLSQIDERKGFPQMFSRGRAQTEHRPHTTGEIALAGWNAWGWSVPQDQAVNCPSSKSYLSNPAFLTISSPNIYTRLLPCLWSRKIKVFCSISFVILFVLPNRSIFSTRKPENLLSIKCV